MDHYEELVNQVSHRYRVYCHRDFILDVVAGRLPKSPISIEIHPSNMCNSNCSFCAYKGCNKGELLPSIEFDRITKQIINLKTVQSVVFSGGGEPTINKSLPDSIDMLIQNGIDVGLMTNGVHVGERLLSSLKACSWVRISLNGYDEESYCRITNLPPNSFQKTCNNIKKIVNLKKFNPNLVVGVSCVIDSNYIKCEDLVTFFYVAKSLNVDYVMYRPYEGVASCDTQISKSAFEAVKLKLKKLEQDSRIHTNISTFIREKYKLKNGVRITECPLCDNGLILVISANGTIHPCIESVKNSNNQRGKMSIADYLSSIQIDYSTCTMCRYAHMNREIEKEFINYDKCNLGKDIHWRFL